MTKASTKRKKPRERPFKAFTARLKAIGLLEEISEIARRTSHITLIDLYEGSGKIPSIGNARREVYRHLAESYGKGINEIARLFDRAPSGIMRMLAHAEDRADDA